MELGVMSPVKAVIDVRAGQRSNPVVLGACSELLALLCSFEDAHVVDRQEKGLDALLQLVYEHPALDAGRTALAKVMERQPLLQKLARDLAARQGRESVLTAIGIS